MDKRTNDQVQQYYKQNYDPDQNKLPTTLIFYATDYIMITVQCGIANIIQAKYHIAYTLISDLVVLELYPSPNGLIMGFIGLIQAKLRSH